MSKNRYTNYQNMSTNVEPKTVPNPVEAVEEPTVEPEVVEETVEELTEETVEEVVTESPSKVGVVSGCEKLRVRKSPSLTASVICTIKESTVVIIDESKSTVEFYKICTEAGVEGYCMKKFITVKA